METLEQQIRRMEETRDKYPHGSENWNFFNDSVKAMRKELHARAEDERYAVRGPWNADEAPHVR